MATLTLNIPDAQINRVVDALCAVNGWTEDAGVNRVTFAKGCLVRDLTATVLTWERRQAEQAALEGVTVDELAIT